MLAYLEYIELPHLTPIFKDNGIDGKFLLSLSDESLQAAGIAPLQCKKIRMCLEEPAVGGDAAVGSEPVGSTTKHVQVEGVRAEVQATLVGMQPLAKNQSA